MVECSNMLRQSLVVIGLLVLGACSFTGTKGGTPRWKVYRDEHKRPVPTMSVRSGPVELRLTQVALVRSHTVLKTVGWGVSIRATIVSSETLPSAALSRSFKLFGRGGNAYDAHSSPHNANRAWQNVGNVLQLPAGVPGELHIVASLNGTGDSVPDELTALEFSGMRLQLQ